MKGWRSTLATGAHRLLSRPLTGEEAAAFERYVGLIIAWQRVHRLVGRADPDWITEHVLLDSLAFLRVIPAAAVELLDLGSGAGIPGISLKIVRPAFRLTFIEARRRRASFLATVARELSLRETRVIGERAEDVIGSEGAKFDVTVMRCAGPAADIFPLAARFVRPGGIVIGAGPADGGAIAWKDRDLGATSRVITVPGWRAGQERTFVMREC